MEMAHKFRAYLEESFNDDLQLQKNELLKEWPEIEKHLVENDLLDRLSSPFLFERFVWFLKDVDSVADETLRFVLREAPLCEDPSLRYRTIIQDVLLRLRSWINILRETQRLSGATKTPQMQVFQNEILRTLNLPTIEEYTVAHLSREEYLKQYWDVEDPARAYLKVDRQTLNRAEKRLTWLLNINIEDLKWALAL